MEVDENIDSLDIYAEFLGEEEYTKIKESYERAVRCMRDMCELEVERLKMEVVQPEDIENIPEQRVEEFKAIHRDYIKAGKSRELYN